MVRGMRRRYDAVVVGSGFGGGVSACRLAEAGLSVCVLERGRRFAPTDFAERPEQAPQLLWHHSANPGGIFDVRLFKEGAVVAGTGVGGGSLIYLNAHLSPSPEVFDSGWPAGLDHTALEPFYKRVEGVLEPRATPDRLDKVRAFGAAGAHVERPSQLVPLVVHWGEDRINPFSDVPQQGCTNLARCMLGCPRHAKNTIDLTYLARAERHGAVVFALHEVVRLEAPRQGRPLWRVGFRDLHHKRGGDVEARLVVLAGGSMGSTRLLLHNRRRLPGLSPALGSRFSANGNALGAIFDPQEPDVQGAAIDVGPTITSMLDYRADRQFVLQDLGAPPHFLGLLETLRGAQRLVGPRRRLLQLKSAATRLGLSDRSVTPRTVRLRSGRPSPDTLTFLFVGRDASNGSMRLTPILRRFDVVYRERDNKALYERMSATLEELGRAVRGQAAFSPASGPLGRFLIAHPLGGCPMSDDPATGVVDQYGRVYGYEDGLLVLDGAIVPTALAVNPSKTIAALAERGIEHYLSERSGR